MPIAGGSDSSDSEPPELHTQALAAALMGGKLCLDCLAQKAGTSRMRTFELVERLGRVLRIHRWITACSNCLMPRLVYSTVPPDSDATSSDPTVSIR